MDKTRARELLAKVGRHAAHLPSCASNTEQTAEFCDCGYKDAAKAYYELWEMLGRQ
jgi:hypothetical protein